MLRGCCFIANKLSIHGGEGGNYFEGLGLVTAGVEHVGGGDFPYGSTFAEVTLVEVNVVESVGHCEVEVVAFVTQVGE